MPKAIEPKSYTLVEDENGIYRFVFHTVTDQTFEAWRAFHAKCYQQGTGNVLVLIDTDGYSDFPFARLTSGARILLSGDTPFLPTRHAWVMPLSNLTGLAEQMIRLLPVSDMKARFFAPGEQDAAYAWLLEEQAAMIG